MAHVGEESGFELVGSLGFLLGYEQFPFHLFHFRDVPFDVQQDGGEVVAFNLHLSLVQIDGGSVSVAFFRNPVHLFAGPGYFNVLCSFFLGSLQGIKVEVVFPQCLLYGDFAVVRFAVAVEVLEVVVDILHDNACREVFDDFVQNQVELFDLLLMPDACGYIPSESPDRPFAFVTRYPIGVSFYGEYFRTQWQRIVNNIALGGFSAFDTFCKFFPRFFVSSIRRQVVYFQFRDVLGIADAMSLLEAAVAEYQCTVFVCRVNIFGGVVDGMCQQVDIVAPLLNVGDILYISFQNGIFVFMIFACKGLEPYIENLFLKQDAVVHTVFHFPF